LKEKIKLVQEIVRVAKPNDFNLCWYQTLLRDMKGPARDPQHAATMAYLQLHDPISSRFSNAEICHDFTGKKIEVSLPRERYPVLPEQESYRVDKFVVVVVFKYAR
jgi:hypothetical protein